jgi:hypothetical protein
MVSCRWHARLLVRQEHADVAHRWSLLAVAREKATTRPAGPTTQRESWDRRCQLHRLFLSTNTKILQTVWSRSVTWLPDDLVLIYSALFPCMHFQSFCHCTSAFFHVDTPLGRREVPNRTKAVVERATPAGRWLARPRSLGFRSNEPVHPHCRKRKTQRDPWPTNRFLS